MPRTKRPVKKAEKSTEGGETLKKYEKLVAVMKKKVDVRAQMEVRNIEIAFKILLGSISTNYLQMTIGELRNELYLKEVTNTRRSRQGLRSASHDDAPPPSSRSTTRRSRSADASSRKPSAPPSANRSAPRRRSRSVYRTPAYNKNAPVNYPAITPKVAPHTALTVLRQPRQGEMVVSMTGSPVMVPTYSSMQADEQANCNIMLQDGTMLSLQPKHLRQSQAYIPFSLMNQNVLEQLETLKGNLDTVLRLGKKAIQ